MAPPMLHPLYPGVCRHGFSSLPAKAKGTENGQAKERMCFAKIPSLVCQVYKRQKCGTKQVHTNSDIRLKKDPLNMESLCIERHGFSIMKVCTYAICTHVCIFLFKYST